MDESELNSKAEDLVAKIREFSKSQKELWQKIPYLSLQADGRAGYSDGLSRAYRNGFWELECSLVSGFYQVYVDLETGELVNASSVSARQASDKNVLKIALNLEQLNAQKIITCLEERACQPYPTYENPIKQDSWRVETKEKLNLTETYSRTK